MSQEKVDLHKQQKKNVKKNIKKRKIGRVVRITVYCLIGAALIGWAGYSGYSKYTDYKSENPTMTTINLDGINDYLTDIYSEE